MTRLLSTESRHMAIPDIFLVTAHAAVKVHVLLLKVLEKQDRNPNIVLRRGAIGLL